MSLRAKVVEAMAGGPDVHPAIKQLAALYLDRVLAVLAESADETIQVERKGWRSSKRLGDAYADELLAVLQGEPDE
jgi:hypothetical protein